MFTLKFRARTSRGLVPKRRRFVFMKLKSHPGKEHQVPVVHHLSVEYFVDEESDGPPDLQDDSFASESSDEQEPLNSCSLESSSGRRVSFLLPSGIEGSNRNPIVPRSSALTAESLLKGDIPLSKPTVVGELDVSSASIPGNKIWIVGTIPEETLEDEDFPCDVVQDIVTFDERCDYCKDSPSPSCACATTCQKAKVFGTSPGCLQIEVNEPTLAVSLPPFVTLKSALRRSVVVDSNLPEDLKVYVDEKECNIWDVESFFLVLVQLVLLKVSSSI